jgi:hypothetical protein
MDGSAVDTEARLRIREGKYERVAGTHWQILYPDLMPAGGG